MLSSVHSAPATALQKGQGTRSPIITSLSPTANDTRMPINIAIATVRVASRMREIAANIWRFD